MLLARIRITGAARLADLKSFHLKQQTYGQATWFNLKAQVASQENVMLFVLPKNTSLLELQMCELYMVIEQADRRRVFTLEPSYASYSI